MSKGLNFVYDYTASASAGPVVTLAGDVADDVTPDIVANVPVANMCSLFQFEDVDINSDSTLKDKINTGSDDVINNSRSLRLDFTPLEQVILGIENKLSGSTTFQDDVANTVSNLSASISGTTTNGSTLLDKLPAAALISRDSGPLQLTGLLTDILNSGPTYYSKNSSTSEYTAIIQLFGQAALNGMLTSGQDPYADLVEYTTYDIGFPALKVIFGSADYLDITIKYNLSNEFIYRVQQTLGSIRTGGTFTVAGTTFTIDSNGRLIGNGISSSQVTEVTYRIRFVASNNSSVFNISDSSMADRYNAALVSLGMLYNNTGSPNGYKFDFIKSNGLYTRISPPSTFFTKLKAVTDNLKSADGTITFQSLVTSNAYLSRSVFLNGRRIPALPYLNSYVYNTPVTENIITNPNDILSLQGNYALATSSYLTNTAMVYNLNSTLRPQLIYINSFYANGVTTTATDYNLSTFNHLIVLSASLDTTNKYTFTKTGTERVRLKLQNSETEYDLGKSLLLVPRTIDNYTGVSPVFKIDDVTYSAQGANNFSVSSGSPLVINFGERYNDDRGGIIMCIPNENIRFGAAFYDTGAKATLPATTYALVTGNNTVVHSSSLPTQVFVRKPGSLPISTNSTGTTSKTYTIQSANVIDDPASITVGYYTTSSTLGLNRDIKWIEMPRLQPLTYAPADGLLDTSVYSYAYLDVNNLKVKFKADVTNKKVYFYNAGLKSGTITTSSDLATISLGTAFTLSSGTKNIWLVTQDTSDGTFTKQIVKCYVDLAAAEAANPPGGQGGQGGNTITSALGYVIEYNNDQNGDVDVSTITVNGLTPSGTPTFTAPCLVTVTNTVTLFTNTYAFGKTATLDWTSAGLVFSIDGDTISPVPIDPQTYTAQTRFLNNSDEIPEENIVKLGTDYYLVVEPVTEAPNPQALQSGYVKFFF